MGPGKTLDLIAGYGSQAALVFQYNQLPWGVLEHDLAGKTCRPTDIGYNSLDRGVDDKSTNSIFIMNYGGSDISYLQKIHHNDFDLGGGTLFTNDQRSTGISFAASYTGVAGGFTNIEVSDNTFHNFWKPYRRGIGLWNNAASPGTSGGISNARIERNIFNGNASTDLGSTGIRLLGKVVNVTVQNNLVNNVQYGFRGMAYNGHITSASDVLLTNNSFSFITTPVEWQGSDTLNASGNWWGTNVQAEIKALANGGVGIDYTPWLAVGNDTTRVTPASRATSPPCGSMTTARRPAAPAASRKASTWSAAARSTSPRAPTPPAQT